MRSADKQKKDSALKQLFQIMIIIIIISKLVKECNSDGMFMCRRYGYFTLCGQAFTLSVNSNGQVHVGLQNLTVMTNLVSFYRNTISVVMTFSS